MFEKLKAAGRALAGKTEQPQPQSQLAKGGNEKPNPYERSGFSGKQKRTPREIYMEGGPVADIADAYHIYTLAPGHRLMCEEGQDPLKDLVQQWLDQPHVDFETIMALGILDSVLNKTAYQEKVPVRMAGLSRWPVWGVVPRDATTFKTIYDKWGRVQRYEQTVGDSYKKEVITLQPEQMLTLSLFPVPGDVEGTSIFQRAYDNIMQDADVADSNVCAIHRHGHPKSHTKVGNDEHPSNPEELDKIRREFENLSSKNDFVTSHLVDVNGIDLGGAGDITSYSNATLSRLALAMGVPRELAGLVEGGLGSGGPSVRMDLFLDKIESIQKRVARAYTRQLIDVITGKPGLVWIEFNKIDRKDFVAKAGAIASLRAGPDPDAVCDAALAREIMGFPPDMDLAVPDIEEDEDIPSTTTPPGDNKHPDEVQEVV